MKTPVAHAPLLIAGIFAAPSPAAPRSRPLQDMSGFKAAAPRSILVVPDRHKSSTPPTTSRHAASTARRKGLLRFRSTRPSLCSNRKACTKASGFTSSRLRPSPVVRCRRRALRDDQPLGRAVRGDHDHGDQWTSTTAWLPAMARRSGRSTRRCSTSRRTTTAGPAAGAIDLGMLVEAAVTRAAPNWLYAGAMANRQVFVSPNAIPTARTR